jgi:hypothetical protein
MGCQRSNSSAISQPCVPSQGLPVSSARHHPTIQPRLITQPHHPCNCQLQYSQRHEYHIASSSGTLPHRGPPQVYQRLSLVNSQGNRRISLPQTPHHPSLLTRDSGTEYLFPPPLGRTLSAVSNAAVYMPRQGPLNSPVPVDLQELVKPDGDPAQEGNLMENFGTEALERDLIKVWTAKRMKRTRGSHGTMRL